MTRTRPEQHAAASRREPQRRRSGVSLMEVTIALTILAFGLLAGASAQLSAMRFSSESRQRMEAQYLAQQQIEMLQAMTPTAIGAFPNGVAVNDPGNPIDADPLPGPVRQQYTRTWTVTRDNPVNGVFRILVQVSWASANTGTVRSVNLESLKSET